MTEKSRRAASIDPFHLYECSVQGVEADLDFVLREYRKANGRPLRRLREDFCGTATLACSFVKRHRDHHAFGVDLDRPTLAWAREHSLAALGADAERVRLMRQDVRRVTEPQVEAVVALNFSYWVFKARADLGAYFRAVRRSLAPGGLFVLDLFGGTEALCPDLDRRRIPASTTFDGTRVPAFTYVWDQRSFDPVTHDFQCAIHFRLPGGRRMQNAFEYDWRFWMLPELRELLAEAGFARSEPFLDSWLPGNRESDGVFRRRKTFDNEGVWVAYLVGYA